MFETRILDEIDNVSLGSLSNAEKAIIFADINSELSNNRFASSIQSLILSKINDLTNGLYKEAQIVSKDFQDFSETEKYPEAFNIINKDEIDAFLNKMTNKDFKGVYFDGTFEFYHPTENLHADGLPVHRSNYNKIPC